MTSTKNRSSLLGSDVSKLCRRFFYYNYYRYVYTIQLIFLVYLRHADEREFLEAQVLALAGAFFHLARVDARRRQRSQRHAVAEEHDYVFGDSFIVHVLDFLGYRGPAVFDPELSVCAENKKSTPLLFYFYICICMYTLLLSLFLL